MNWAGSIYLLAVAWPLARTDIREHRLPNKYTLPAIGIALTANLLAAWIGNQWTNLLLSIVCAVVAFAASLLANRFATLGMGDVKLITAISLCLGWFSPMSPMFALIYAFVIAGLVVLVKLALRKTRMGQSIALGPYLISGFIFSLVQELWKGAQLLWF
jgi:leader peptidase (prepilin peptidase)/N-methyltransferase